MLTPQDIADRRRQAVVLKQAAELVLWAHRPPLVGQGPLLLSIEGFIISLTTPFNWPRPQQGTAGRVTDTPPRRVVSYVLDIYEFRTVFTLTWTRAEDFRILRFLRGTWEERLLRFADTCHVRNPFTREESEHGNH